MAKVVFYPRWQGQEDRPHARQFMRGSCRTQPAIAVSLAVIFIFAILTLWVHSYWPVSLFEALIFVLADVVLVVDHNAGRSPRYPFFVFAFAVGWGILQAVFGKTVYEFDTERSLLRWTTFLAVYLIGAYIFQDDDILQRFRAAMVWFGAALAIEAVLQSFVSPGFIFGIFPSGYSENMSIMGPIVYHSHYAAFVETVLPMAVYGALTDRNRSYLYAAAGAALYASVIVSASRAGLILATAEVLLVVIVFYLRPHSGKRVDRLSILRLAALTAAFLLVVGWGSISHRLAEANPMVGRREFAISSLHMIAARPWWGFGLGTWSTVYPRYAVMDFGDVFVNQAHSDWLQWGAEGGLPLLIVMASLFVWLVRPAFRSVWGIGVVAVFVHALVDYPFSRPALGAWPILVLAMLAASHRKRGRSPQPAGPFPSAQHLAP